MRMNVDESGGDDAARGVDPPRRLECEVRADGDDAVVRHRHVCGDAGGASAVDHSAVFNDQVARGTHNRAPGGGWFLSQ